MQNKNFNLNNYNTLFFDLFHTLTYPGRIEHKRHERDLFGISEEEWLAHSMATYKERAVGIVNKPEDIIRNILISLKHEYKEEKLSDAAEIRTARFSKSLIEIKKEVLITIKQLFESGFKLCLVSNADVIDIAGWSSSPLAKFFDKAIFSCEVGLAKPSPEIYQLALKEMHAVPKQSLFIGDGGSDELNGAKAVGINTVLTTEFIQDLWPEKIDTLRKDADFVVTKLSSILKSY